MMIVMTVVNYVFCSELRRLSSSFFAEFRSPLRWFLAPAVRDDVRESCSSVRRRVWGVHFARVNARLKLARVHSAQGCGLPTAAGRGRSHTVRARADTDSNFHGGQFGYRSAAHASGRFGG